MDRFGLSNNATFVFPTAGGAPGSFIISSKDTGGTTLVARMTVLGQSGNVGIGSTSPAYKLDVNGGAADTTLGVQTTGQNPVRLRLKNEERDFILTNNPGDDLLSFNYDGNNRLQFNTTNQWFNSGNVGINTTSPAARLDVAGNGRFISTASYVLEINQNIANNDFADAIFISNTQSGQRVQFGMSTNDSDGQHHRVSLRAYKGSGIFEGVFGIVMRQASTSTHVQRLTLSAAGTLTVDGDVVAYSDRRTKENIKTIENSLDKVLSLRGVSYNRIDENDKAPKIGVIAQEVQEILPEVVFKQEDGMLGVAYGNIVGVLIEAIKELKTEVEDLKYLLSQK
jgi:hypothetical protein